MFLESGNGEGGKDEASTRTPYPDASLRCEFPDIFHDDPSIALPLLEPLHLRGRRHFRRDEHLFRGPLSPHASDEALTASSGLTHTESRAERSITY